MGLSGAWDAPAHEARFRRRARPCWHDRPRQSRGVSSRRRPRRALRRGRPPTSSLSPRRVFEPSPSVTP
eukprot:5187865-Alexandrium_andersonii.AAC.1